MKKRDPLIIDLNTFYCVHCAYNENCNETDCRCYPTYKELEKYFKAWA